LALFLATCFGLGYLPRAPGTWGSLAGVGLAWVLFKLFPYGSSVELALHGVYFVVAHVHLLALLALAQGLVGVWATGRAERYLGIRDPQVVVIDEVSGQFMTLLLAGRVCTTWPGREMFLQHPLHISLYGTVNWKYLLLGFILFRAFDIWKPFPVRQAERLPGGWGIMADDWLAAIYAGLGLWLARALGL